MRKSAPSKLNSTKVLKSAPSKLNSTKVLKSAPSKLNGEVRKPPFYKVLENYDLRDLLIKSFEDAGVVKTDIAFVSKKMATLDVQEYSFIANSTRFKLIFLKDIQIIRKNTTNLPIMSINKFKSELQYFMFYHRTYDNSAIYYNNRLNEKVNMVRTFYQNYLQHFIMTSNYDHIFNICDMLTTFAKTLIEYMDYNTRSTDLFEGTSNPYIHVGHRFLTARDNRNVLIDVVKYTRPIFDKYVFLAYEYNKLCIIHYIKWKSKNSNNKKILVLLKNIMDLHIYNKNMYPALRPSKSINISNDRICFLFLKYYFEGISKNLTPINYIHLQQFTAQTVLKNPQIPYENFIKNTAYHEELYYNCIDFIFKKKGIAYELSHRFDELNLYNE